MTSEQALKQVKQYKLRHQSKSLPISLRLGLCILCPVNYG